MRTQSNYMGKAKLQKKVLTTIMTGFLFAGISNTALADNVSVPDSKTDAQTIGAGNTAAGDGCTMRITYMFRRQPCTVIDVDFLDQKVVIQNKTDDILHRAFGVLEHPTWNDFENFLRDRCFPQTRGNCKELLQEMELTDYDPLKIVEKTRGRLADDEMWLRLRYLPRKEIIYASH